MAFSIRSKLPGLQLSVFAVISKLAEAHGAINLSQGFPDFDCDPALSNLVAEFLKAGKNQYAPMPGILPLRKALAKKIRALYSADYDPESEITITAGATEALFAAITASVSSGDEVIIFEPFYDAYPPVVQYSGGKPVFVPLQAPGFKIPWEKVKKAITPRTRLIIINSPHNPTGSILTENDLEQLAGLVEGTPIAIVSDEVYEHIVFDGKKHLSLASHPGLRKRTFVISSFGKTYHTTGWKVGYCATPQPLTTEFRKIHQFITYAVNTPVQWAYAAFLEQDQSYLTLNEFYQQKRDFFRRAMEKAPFDLLPCNGTYFQLADYRRVRRLDDRTFAEWLIREHGVAAIPLSPFYSQPPDQTLIRFCFAKTQATLQAAAERLCRI